MPRSSSAALHNRLVGTVMRVQSQERANQVSSTLGSPATGIVLVRNISGAAVPRFGVLAIAGVAIEPAANQVEFEKRPVLDCTSPSANRRSVVILQEPLADEAIGRAIALGISVANVFVEDGDEHPYAFADVTADETEHLLATHSGPAAILWRESGSGARPALVCLSARQPALAMAVALAQSGGAQGTQSAPATWTYTVKDLDGNTIEEDVDPSDGRHRFVRPSVGFMIPATFGYAHTHSDGGIVLGWINEVAEQESC